MATLVCEYTHIQTYTHKHKHTHPSIHPHIHTHTCIYCQARPSDAPWLPRRQRRRGWTELTRVSGASSSAGAGLRRANIGGFCHRASRVLHGKRRRRPRSHGRVHVRWRRRGLRPRLDISTEGLLLTAQGLLRVSQLPDPHRGARLRVRLLYARVCQVAAEAAHMRDQT